MKHPLCPFCHQVLDYPEEFKGLQLTQAELTHLWQLWNARETIVPHGSIPGRFQSKQVSYSHIRKALLEIGSIWTVKAIYGEGMMMTQVEPRGDTP